MAQKRPTPAALGLHVPAYTLTCVVCNYAAQSYNAYIGHLISCPDLPQVRCSHCSTTFRDTEQLALHLGEPPLLSFLFDPPTTSSTTAVTTTAATVFTTTLSLPPHSPFPTYVQPTPTPPATISQVTTVPPLVFPTPTPHYSDPYLVPQRMPNTASLPSSPFSSAHVVYALNRANLLINYQTLLIAWLTHYLLLIPYPLWSINDSDQMFVRSVLAHSPHWPHQLPADAPMIDLVRTIQHEFAELLLRSPYY